MKKVILFGDSITAGYLAGEVTPLLRDLVEQDLEAQDFTDFEVISAGVPGETTREGLARIEDHVVKYDPAYVTIFFGINDLATDKLVPIDEYEENLRKMIEMVGAEKVILITPPYVTSKKQPERPVERILAYGEKVHELSKEYDTPIIDMYHHMTLYPGSDEFVQEDGLHFSEWGYEFLAALIINALKVKMAESGE